MPVLYLLCRLRLSSGHMTLSVGITRWGNPALPETRIIDSMPCKVFRTKDSVYKDIYSDLHGF